MKIVEGDLAGKGSTLQVVFGIDKLKQDLDLWLRERYGGDRFHPNMGSTLQEYIGGVVSQGACQEIQGEALRVLQNYQELQIRILKSDPQLLSYSEMLISIEEVTAVGYYDSVYVRIRIRNGSNEVQTIVTEVTV